MYNILPEGCSRARIPPRAKLPEEGCVPCALADCWGAELCYGSVQCRSGTWPLSVMMELKQLRLCLPVMGQE